MSERPIRVLVADDQSIARAGLLALLSVHDDLETVGSAGDGHTVLRLTAELAPDLILMDVVMPGLDGIATTRALRESSGPRPRVLLISHYDDPEQVAAALRAGARGYLTKEATGDEIVAAIRKVHAGETYVPAALSTQVAMHLVHDPISPREREVLVWLSKGLTNREIAAQLAVAPSTVAMHVRTLLDKVGASNRTELVALALARGLVRSG